MKVSELKEIAPLADAYELNPEARHIIFIERGAISESALRKVAREANATVFTVSQGCKPTMFELSD